PAGPVSPFGPCDPSAPSLPAAPVAPFGPSTPSINSAKSSPVGFFPVENFSFNSSFVAMYFHLLIDTKIFFNFSIPDWTGIIRVYRHHHHLLHLHSDTNHHDRRSYLFYMRLITHVASLYVQ